MMLRASIAHRGQEGGVDAITGETGAAPLPGGQALVEFADAVVAGDALSIQATRDRVRSELGDEAAVDAAAVIANFQRMVRIADGTGIPLDPPMMVMTEKIRDDLGINAFGSAKNTRALPWWARVAARLLAPLNAKIFGSLPRLVSRGGGGPASGSRI